MVQTSGIDRENLLRSVCHALVTSTSSSNYHKTCRHIQLHYLPDRNVRKLSRVKRFKSSGLVVWLNMVSYSATKVDARAI